MQIGMVGLGRMGGNMTTRLLRGGHDVVGFAPNPDDVQRVVAQGATGAASLAELVGALSSPRVVWLMVPAGDATASTIAELADLLDPDDLVVDGGNSRYTESIERAASLSARGIRFADAGVSGGIWGLESGFCLMVGAEPAVFAQLEPVLGTLAPPSGYALVGPVGAGHFTKMVHNAIEYGLMQAYAEGFELLDASGFDMNVGAVAELWRHGSVVRSWLLDLAAQALSKDPGLSSVAPYVEDSGEGRWALESAVERAVSTPALAAALFTRFASRQDDSVQARVLAALRREFGGHEVHSDRP